MPELQKRKSILPRVAILLSIILWISSVSVSNGFVSRNLPKRNSLNDIALRGWFMDEKASSSSKVQKPKNFVTPEPKPLQIPESTDLGRFARNSLALAARLGVGAFVLGWKIDTIFFKEDGTDP